MEGRVILKLLKSKQFFENTTKQQYYVLTPK